MANRRTRIVVTGGSGQVITAMKVRAVALSIEVVALSRPEFNLEDRDSILAQISATKPDVVVNAAAYTAVDRAESEPERAHVINALGAEAVANAAATLGIPIIQMSTDYVFDGTATRPWREDDPTGPIGVYGATKLEGEIRVSAASPNHAILRTSWVHAPWGLNFVRTMLRLASNREEVAVVADQYGAPTSAIAVADGIAAVAKNLIARPSDSNIRGVFHMTCAGETTWAGFADTIFAESRELGGPTARVRPISTADYPTAARRPANSRLDGSRLAEQHGVRLPDWRSQVRASVVGVVSELNEGTAR